MINFEIGKQYIVRVTEKGIIPVEEFNRDQWYDKDHDDLDFLTDEERSKIIEEVLDSLWVYTSDRLHPPTDDECESETVIICYKNKLYDRTNYVDNLSITMAMYGDYLLSSDGLGLDTPGWIDIRDDEEIACEDVIAWMPIPYPPKTIKSSISPPNFDELTDILIKFSNAPDFYDITNGDLIVALFPNKKVTYERIDDTVYYMIGDYKFSEKWWNAKYRVYEGIKGEK